MAYKGARGPDCGGSGLLQCPGACPPAEATLGAHAGRSKPGHCGSPLQPKAGKAAPKINIKLKKAAVPLLFNCTILNRFRMRQFHIILLFFILIPIIKLSAQGVTIGSANPPDAAAILDLQSNQKGLLLPRLSTAQRNAIVLPVRALVIYNTSNECIEGYFPSGWKVLQCNCSSAPPSPALISGPTLACPADTGLLFSIAAVSGATSYQWTIGSTDTLISGTGTDSVRVNLSALTGQRSISVRAVNFCGSSLPATLSLNVSVPDSTFTVQPSTPIINNAAQFNANQSNATYAWTFPSGTPGTSTAQNPSVTWTQTGIYAVQLLVTDANGCQSQKTDSITVTNCSPATWTFSTCGQSGRTGPTQAQCNASYGSGVVTVSSGVQLWTVPATGNYTIQAAGAEGGDKGDYLNQSGKGAIVSGSVSLNAGTVLAIVVGQRGGQCFSANSSGGGGGGGGSYVYNNQNNTLYVAAGGGGGIGAGNSTRKPGRNASTGQSSGTNQQDNNNGPSSYNYNAATGNGGGSYGLVFGQGDYDSGGGAGWNGNGMNGVQFPGTEGGKSRANGFFGGNYDAGRNPYVAIGGFGGGGGASDGGGGGGGYTGGNGGRWNNLATGGGGGASYVLGNNNPSSLGNQSGHGQVIISRTCP